MDSEGRRVSLGCFKDQELKNESIINYEYVRSKGFIETESGMSRHEHGTDQTP